MTTVEKAPGVEMLRIDAAKEAERITQAIRRQLGQVLKRRGAVLGLSGGIDSSVTAALCVRAVGKERVLALLMPEVDSDAETLELSTLMADHLGVRKVHHDISPMLAAMGCYERRDEAIRKVIPAYGAGWKNKIAITNPSGGGNYHVFYLVAHGPAGERVRVRLELEPYLEIVAATNFKQRVRKMLEYYHADRLHYAVAGTPNRLEYDQGFFVKNGDGAADIKPIAHLYKSQVYQLAEYLGIPETIQRRPPTTDTYSLEQTQDEFYFALPYQQMDVCLHGKNHGMTAGEVAEILGLTEVQVKAVYHDIEAKRSTTRYLHTRPLLVEEVTELNH